MEDTTTTQSLRRARIRAIVTGIAFFFPGFLFSLALTCTWASHYYAGEAQASLGAIPPSLAIGVIAAIACTRYLLRKVNLKADQDAK